MIGEGSVVWDGALVRGSLGRDCIVGRHAYVDEGVIVGDRVKIEDGALLYRGAFVGDEVFIGPNVVLTNDRWPRATSGGHLATAADWECQPVTLEDGCSIGAGSVILPGVTVGARAMVGAGSVVTRDVPPDSLVRGNPAAIVVR